MRNINAIANYAMTKDTLTEEQCGNLPIPFTLEELRHHILNIFLFEARINLRLGIARPLASLKLDVDNSDTWDYTVTAPELGLDYAMVADTPFAAALEDQYFYAFHAQVQQTAPEPIGWDSIHTWVAAHLLSLSGNAEIDEANLEGDYATMEAVKSCLLVNELANARLVLEENQYFHSLNRQGKEDADGSGIHGLSIRQMAMLAGMEEMSLRSALSRKTAPTLKTTKVDRGTYVDPTDAIEWLKAKGRYMPVRRRAAVTGALDLSLRRFESVHELLHELKYRWQYVIAKTGDQAKGRVEQLLDRHQWGEISDIDSDHLMDPEFMKELADALELPEKLLLLRATEAVLRGRLSFIEHDLKKISQNRS